MSQQLHFTYSTLAPTSNCTTLPGRKVASMAVGGGRVCAQGYLRETVVWSLPASI